MVAARGELERSDRDTENLTFLKSRCDRLNGDRLRHAFGYLLPEAGQIEAHVTSEDLPCPTGEGALL